MEVTKVNSNTEQHNAIDINATRSIKELVAKNYRREVGYNIRSRYRWKLLGDLTEALARLFTAISIVLSFASGFFKLELLAFVAGCLGTISLVTMQLSSYAMKESKERTQQTNILLNKLGLESIPDIVIDSALLNRLSNEKTIVNV